jgi:Domain of unknown function (DUF4055)
MADVSHSRIPDKALARWALVREICAGGDHEVLGHYLPYLNKHDPSAENVERNRAYKERAVLYNATGRTRDGLLGLAFRRDPAGLDELPPRLSYLADDCDGAGISLYQQSQASLKAVLETARHGLYVDYSDALMGPIIKAYRAEDIINWRATLIDGKTVLSMVVLAEEAEVDDGYETHCIPQWRELLLENGVFVVKVWQKRKDEEEPTLVEQIVPRSVGGTLDEIPFVFIGAQNNDSTIDDAPLYDLAYINRAHYRNSADYEDSVFLVGQPQPWIAGLTEEWRNHLEKEGKAYLGSRAMLPLPVGGSFGIAQPSPNSMAKEAMDHKEAQMIALGARLIEATQANRTATESDNDKEASTSVLSMCCANVSDAYTRAIAWCARYLDLALAEGEGEYKINQDFARVQAEPQMITALVGAWQSGAFAKPDLRAFLRRIGVIAVERTDEDIDSDSDSEGPALGAMGDPLEGDGTGETLPAAVEESTEPREAPLDLSPIVAAIQGLKAPEWPDLAGLIAAVKNQPAPTVPPLDLSPLAALIQRPTDFTPLAQAITAGMAAMKPEPVDYAPLVAGMTQAIASMPAPNVTFVNQKPSEVKFTEDAQGRVTGALLN